MIYIEGKGSIWGGCRELGRVSASTRVGEEEEKSDIPR
jgi:hypothetical protein